VRQLLLEAFLLSVLGGVVGLLLAFWLTRLFALSALSALPYVLVFNTTRICVCSRRAWDSVG